MFVLESNCFIHPTKALIFLFLISAAFLLDLDVALEEDEPQRHYVPERLETLCDETGLSKQQLRALYRAFKEACPNGAITEPIFRSIYCQIFPLGGKLH